MKDRKHTTRPLSRGRYSPPQYSKVRIRLDEVVLAACKTAGGGNVPAASCVVSCFSNGS